MTKFLQVTSKTVDVKDIRLIVNGYNSIGENVKVSLKPRVKHVKKTNELLLAANMKNQDTMFIMEIEVYFGETMIYNSVIEPIHYDKGDTLGLNYNTALPFDNYKEVILYE